MTFTGFTKEALQFLFENRMQNSKEWYDSHKDIYKKHVYNPFVELVMEVAPTIAEIDSQMITIPSKLISRVRRDTRFTKDKTLYRDNAWIVFLRDKSQMANSPCYWFELGQEGTSYGIGYYGAEPSSMARLREMILKGHPVFNKAMECYESQNVFRIGGETYKRSKHPDKPDNLRQWLDRKNIFFESAQKGYALAFSRELPERLKDGYKLLKPIYELFCIVESSTVE